MVPKDNRKQNPEESYTNKYQKQVACSYVYKLLCVGGKFSKPFKSYLGEDGVYNVIISMIEERKFCTDIMKKHFNKKLAMTMVKIFKTLINVEFVVMFMLKFIIARNYCHITGKCWNSAQRDCNINVKLNHEIPIVFHKLKNYDFLTPIRIKKCVTIYASHNLCLYSLFLNAITLKKCLVKLLILYVILS